MLLLSLLLLLILLLLLLLLLLLVLLILVLRYGGVSMCSASLAGEVAALPLLVLAASGLP